MRWILSRCHVNELAGGKFLAACVALVLASSTARATVDLTQVNSYPVLDGGRSTPLEEIVSTDDLAQSVLVGPNGVIDPPTLMDTPGGSETPPDGARGNTGVAAAPSNQPNQPAAPHDVSPAGVVSVRFRDFNPAANADFHGDPMLLSLTSGAASALALQDVASFPSEMKNAGVVPAGANGSPGLEPSSIFLLAVIVLAVWLYLKGDLKAPAVRTVGRL